MARRYRLLCVVLCSSCAGDPSEPESPAIVVQEAVSSSPTRDRARKVDHYLMTWAWSAAGAVRLTTGAIDGMTFVQWDLNQGDIGSGYRDVNLLFQLQKPGGVTTGTIYEHVYTSSDPASPYLDYFAENDAAKIYYHAEIGPAFTWKHFFIDDDHNPATGYPMGGVGAGYLIENGRLYRYTAARPGWGWTVIGDAHLVVNGRGNDWWISRSDLGAAAGSPFHQVVFQANGGVPAAYVSPIYAHRFSP